MGQQGDPGISGYQVKTFLVAAPPLSHILLNFLFLLYKTSRKLKVLHHWEHSTIIDIQTYYIGIFYGGET